jgi:hypothetical protein
MLGVFPLIVHTPSCSGTTEIKDRPWVSLHKSYQVKPNISNILSTLLRFPCSMFTAIWDNASIYSSVMYWTRVFLWLGGHLYSNFKKAVWRPIRLLAISSNDKIMVRPQIAVNILHGNIPITEDYKKKLRRYRDVIRSIASKQVGRARKKQTLLRFHIVIPLLMKPTLPLLDG